MCNKNHNHNNNKDYEEANGFVWGALHIPTALTLFQLRRSEKTAPPTRQTSLGLPFNNQAPRNAETERRTDKDKDK